MRFKSDKLIASAKEVMFLPGFVCPFVYLFVNKITQKTYGRILIKFSGYVRNW